MKKIITLAFMALIALTGNAQLKVDSLGAVGIGTNPQYPYKLSISSPRYGIKGISTEYRTDSTAIGVAGIAYNHYHGKAFGVRGIANYNSSGFLDGKCLGVYGYAHGSSSGENYGVFGHVGPHVNGAGVYGSAYFGTDYGQMLTTRYAGYFYGDVEVVGNLTLSGSILYSNNHMYSIGDDNLDLRNAGEYATLLQKLSTRQYVYDPISTMSNKGKDGVEAALKEGEVTKTERQAMSKLHYGLDADQLEKVFPDLVYENEQGTKSINYIEMIPILVQTINELSAKVTTLEEQLGNQNATKAVQKAKKQTTSIEDTGMEVVSMSQNRPNPFKDKSVIALNVPSDTKKAVINIYDISGKQVQSIPVSERGRTNITVYARHLQPGMFVYSLLVDGKVQATRKMMVTE